MKTARMTHSVMEEGEKFPIRKLDSEPREWFKGVRLMIIAVDQENLSENRSTTFHFSNREGGWLAYDILKSTAGRVHRGILTEKEIKNYSVSYDETRT